MYVTIGYAAACLLKIQTWTHVYGTTSDIANIMLNILASELMVKLMQINLIRMDHTAAKTAYNIVIATFCLVCLQMAGFIFAELIQKTKQRYIVFSWYMHPLKHLAINIVPTILINANVNALEYNISITIGTFLSLLLKYEFMKLNRINKFI
jgi:hypothetical protein